jgi:homocysteine S-methyltransferase
MALIPFLDAIDQRVLVCDGSMGTMLYSKGIFVNRSFDALNLSEPDLVAEVQLGYAHAGADVLETNTFGANRVKLGAFDLADKLHAINVQGARIARHAAREQSYVAGAMGPLGIRIEPWGKTGVDEAEEYFREQAAALLDGSVDLFILETFRDLNEIGAAIAAVRALCDLPIVAQMTTEEDGNSLDGTPPEEFAPKLDALGAQVIGLNCSVGPAPMLESIERMARVTESRFSAQPNAGKPREIEGRAIYLCSPDYMASYARRFVAKGVRLVGGCCGTTPDHVRAMKQAVRAMTPAASRVTVAAPATLDAPAAPAVPVAREKKSRLAHSLARGRFVMIVELTPPKGHETAHLIESARALRIRGVDVVNIPDSPPASARMSALSTAVLIEQHAGIETLLHFTCRDRSLIGMQSDLLGAHAMGIRNLLITTGDPPVVGDYPKSVGEFAVDSIGLTNVVTRLNSGLDIGGGSIGSPTSFHLGVAVNPTALDLDLELRRLEYKVEAGAEFAVTQSIFDVAAFEAFLKRIERFRLPVIAGVWPFESLRNAEFMANEVPGVRVPAELIDRMRRVDRPEAAAAEGVLIARDIVARISGAVQGVQVSTPAVNIEAALAVVEAVA